MFEDQRQEDVQEMMERNEEFKRLLLRHRELDKQVTDAELGGNPIEDLALHTLKKEKLWAKDRLTLLWQQQRVSA